MMTAVHTLIYSDDASATRRFLRDVLQWPFVADGPSSDDADVEDGSEWLIFGTGRSELGVHPTMSVWEGKEYRSERHHQIALMCDDIETTKAELESRGAIFESDITDEGFGLAAVMSVPGADPIQIYQPRHAVAYQLGVERPKD